MRTEAETLNALAILASVPEEIAAGVLEECAKAGRDTEAVRALFALASLIRESRERRGAKHGGY